MLVEPLFLLEKLTSASRKQGVHKKKELHKNNYVTCVYFIKLKNHKKLLNSNFSNKLYIPFGLSFFTFNLAS